MYSTIVKNMYKIHLFYFDESLIWIISWISFNFLSTFINFRACRKVGKLWKTCMERQRQKKEHISVVDRQHVKKEKNILWSYLKWWGFWTTCRNPRGTIYSTFFLSNWKTFTKYIWIIHLFEWCLNEKEATNPNVPY